MLPRKRAVTAGVGVDLRAVEADRSHLQHAHLARKQQHADEQPLDLLEKAPPKRGDRVVVGVVVGGDVAERHAIVSRALELAARKHPGGVAVNQNPQQHPGMVRRRPGSAIGADHAAKIDLVDHLDDKAGQMPLRQPRLPPTAAEETPSGDQRPGNCSSPASYPSARTMQHFSENQRRRVKSDRLLLNTWFLQWIDWIGVSAKFNLAWHYAWGGRGGFERIWTGPAAGVGRDGRAAARRCGHS